LIGAGETFNGASTITIPASPSLNFTEDKGFTFSAWIKAAAAQANAVIFSQQEGASSLVIGMDQTGVYARMPGAETKRVALAPGIWHHVAVTAGKRLVVYVDGVEAAAADAVLAPLGGNITLGASFNGDMDEVKISNTARSADWIKAVAQGEGVDAKLIAYGGDEQTEGGDTSYFKTILQSVTLDGWVVIAILMVMAVISWIVMVNKAVVISRMTRDNKKFITSFQKIAADPGVLDRDDDQDDRANKETPFAAALFGRHDHYQSSPIYRVYHVGVQEIKHRFGNTDPKLVGKALSPQAIGAIRASLDGALVRENQKLSSQMVLLTIAISGGPFLGLLGTVVGVMITFAAIAASGDVNVNAIAPGIAAALVATVAGLAVAIPALFGYNYLISKIKNITADMHVFVDEFVHKLAENYGN
jgi:biopolymer transport protein ExbB